MENPPEFAGGFSMPEAMLFARHAVLLKNRCCACS
jgi:hypothetical protein